MVLHQSYIKGLIKNCEKHPTTPSPKFPPSSLRSKSTTLIVVLHLLVGEGVRCSRFFVHLASSAVTPAGSVHKSRGDNVVRNRLSTAIRMLNAVFLFCY